MTSNSARAVAGFQVAAAVGDLLHSSLFLFQKDQQWSLSAAANYILPTGLFKMRCLWLKEFRMEWQGHSTSSSGSTATKKTS